MSTASIVIMIYFVVGIFLDKKIRKEYQIIATKSPFWRKTIELHLTLFFCPLYLLWWCKYHKKVRMMKC